MLITIISTCYSAVFILIDRWHSICTRLYSGICCFLCYWHFFFISFFRLTHFFTHTYTNKHTGLILPVLQCSVAFSSKTVTALRFELLKWDHNHVSVSGKVSVVGFLTRSLLLWDSEGGVPRSVCNLNPCFVLLRRNWPQLPRSFRWSICGKTTLR